VRQVGPAGAARLLLFFAAVVAGALWRRGALGPAAPRAPEVRNADADEELALDLAKLLLASNLEFVRSTSQTLQALNTLLLTTYVALFVALGDEYGFFTVTPVLTALPIVCFGGSLLISVLRSIAVRKRLFVVGDLAQTFSAYESVLKQRRRQVWLPAALTALGVGSIAGVVVAAV